MKSIGLFLLSATMLTGTALADEYRPLSKIAAVTVYPQGADVTRVATLTLKPGDHQLILSDLPGSIDPQSIKVAGEAGAGVEIASVDSKVEPLMSVDVDAQRAALEKQIADLYDERTAQDQLIADADTQRQFLLSLANKQLTPATSQQLTVQIDGGALNGVLDVMGQRLALLAKATQDARLKQKSIDRTIADLQTKISTLAPQAGYRTSITVNLAAASAAEGTFKVSYRVNEAGWQPYYDARLTMPKDGKKAEVELVRRAEVMQSTPESWDNVQLTLSTARPGGATAAPDIMAEELMAEMDGRTRLERKLYKNGVGGVDNELDAPAAEAPVSPVEGMVAEDTAKPAKVKLDAVMQRQAFVELTGLQVNYVIAGRVNIDNSGTSKKVRITTSTAEPKLQALTVPRHDPRAFLTATFKPGGEGSLLPGNVNLYLDGVYVGQGALPLLDSAEEAKLGFGPDDMIKIKRAEVKRRSGEEGIITSSNVEERAWDITVKNLHDFKMPVTVMDRVPFTARDDVSITDIPGLTPPSQRDVDKKRGVLAWTFDLEPKGENTLKTGYKVMWPKEVSISSVE